MAEKKDSIRSLIETGRRAGKLTNSEISDAMEESGHVLNVEQMEKLYEELLIETETLAKTENRMIFIERDEPLERQEIEEKLAALRESLATEDDDVIRKAMKQVVPTFHSPKHVNKAAIESGRYGAEAEGSRAVAAG